MDISKCQAYELVESKELRDIKSKHKSSAGMILRHKKTGARINLISNEDENKVFYIGFRTPSQNSTGVAHIVEHTVLCGSKQFPAKDPFVELVKGSLNTFLNAITYPDKTIYPVASCNDTDFQNLMHVYLDAVFYPNIYQKEEIFRQEGWHYELENEADPITLNGVVYNEMKGAFSSPEGVLDRQILNSLYPDTSYQYESGGDPEVIPELTYQQYLDFHAKYYHPSNSYIYLYGDMDMEQKLNWLDETYLSKFTKITVDSAISRQKPFTKTVFIDKFYSVSSEEPLQENSYLSFNISVDTILNQEFYIAFDVLDYVLLGAPGAPLKKALLDAGIGKDVMSSYDSSVYQPIFSIVAKNSDPEKKDAFLAIISSVLKEQVEQGLNKKSLTAGLNSMEFKYREADYGHYPKGLLFGLQCLDSWLYDDGLPYLHLEPLQVIESLKEKIASDYFEQLVERYLIHNTHASVVIVEPKRGLNSVNEEKLVKKLAAYKDTLTKDEIDRLIKATHDLIAYQETPSTKEELEAIPMLSRSDLKLQTEPLCNELKSCDGTQLLYHAVDSNGIAYLNFLFDINAIRETDMAYLGILKAVMGYVDTENYTYRELADEINLHTGGIGSLASIFGLVKEERYQLKFEVKVKTLYEKIPKAVELIGEIIAKSNYTDTKRLYEIIAQMKSRLQITLSSSGHSISAVRAMSYFSETAKFTDLTTGIALYQVVNRLEQNFEQEKEGLVKKLQELTAVIFRAENLLISCGGEPEVLPMVTSSLPDLTALLFTTPVEKHAMTLTCQKKNEGFMDASQVQYVSRAGNFKKAGFAYTGVLKMLKVILSYEYLWQNIRVKGGAYGCMTGFSRRGDTYFSSYRDPNLEKTNQIFEEIGNYVRNITIADRDMTKYIIGTFSDLDSPLSPAAQVSRSLNAYLTGVTYADLQKERDEILAAQLKDIRALADLLDAVLAEEALCVIGNEDRLRQQGAMFKQLEPLL